MASASPPSLCTMLAALLLLLPLSPATPPPPPPPSASAPPLPPASTSTTAAALAPSPTVPTHRPHTGMDGPDYSSQKTNILFYFVVASSALGAVVNLALIFQWLKSCLASPPPPLPAAGAV